MIKKALMMGIVLAGVMSLGAKGCEVLVSPPDDCTAEDCGGDTEPKDTGEKPQIVTCDDLEDVDFGPCEMLLGWAVLQGECRPVSGCSAAGFVFFETEAQCREECMEPQGGQCDDGSELVCDMTPPPCEEGSVLAVQQGCYACVNPLTCATWGEPGCQSDQDCSEKEYCDWCATSSCPFCDDCVAACLPREPQDLHCTVDADCVLLADFCGGCYCDAHHVDSTVTNECPSEEIVCCFADPCLNKEAICDQGQCLVISQP